MVKQMRYLFEYRDFRRLMFHRLPEFDEQMCTWVYTFTRRCLALGTQVKVSAVAIQERHRKTISKITVKHRESSSL